VQKDGDGTGRNKVKERDSTCGEWEIEK